MTVTTVTPVPGTGADDPARIDRAGQGYAGLLPRDSFTASLMGGGVSRRTTPTFGSRIWHATVGAPRDRSDVAPPDRRATWGILFFGPGGHTLCIVHSTGPVSAPS